MKMSIKLRNYNNANNETKDNTIPGMMNETDPAGNQRIG